MKMFKFIGLVIVLFLASCNVDTSNKNIGDLKNYYLEKANEVTVLEDKVIFNDDYNRVELQRGITDIIILYPSYTTLLYEAGGKASGIIGGNTAIELYKEQIGRDITKDEGVTVLAESALGSKWSIEKILALDSDLIIASSSMHGYETISKPAMGAKIPVISVTYEDFRDYLKWFKVFAYTCGNPYLWEDLALKVLDEVVEIVLNSNVNKNVLSLFSGPKSILANTNNSLMGNMLFELGANNIIEVNDAAERIEVNLEYIYSKNPDIILVSCHASEEEAKKFLENAYGNNKIWQSLEAVREDKVYFLPKMLFHNKPNKDFSASYKLLSDILVSK